MTYDVLSGTLNPAQCSVNQL